MRKPSRPRIAANFTRVQFVPVVKRDPIITCEQASYLFWNFGIYVVAVLVGYCFVGDFLTRGM